MPNDITSIGMVTWPYYMKTKGERSLEQFLRDGFAQCPKLTLRLTNARLINEVEATGNFSYVSERNHGSNYVMLGDAYAFIDPVFSSGVLLAMNSGVIAAEAIDTCLRTPAKAAAALKRFDADEAWAEGILVVHLSRDQSDHARILHGAAQRPAAKELCSPCWRGIFSARHPSGHRSGCSSSSTTLPTSCSRNAPTWGGSGGNSIFARSTTPSFTTHSGTPLRFLSTDGFT
jgi:hypothetical protein